jgi:signal transduction histidine kinase/ABC-type nitrate/sulfonate/bicarbonate transport system substrate-binding protein
MKYLFKFFTIIILFNSYLLATAELKKVTLQLSWLNQFQFAGYYMAKENGYYEELGLDVEIIPYKMGMHLPSMISNRDVDFAIGRENIILERANKHKDLTLLYATFQTSPLMFLTKQSSGINTISDFKDKKIMSTIEDSHEASLKAMISSENIDIKTLNFIEHTHNISDLINDKVDIISAYVSKTPFNLQEKEIKYNIFDPKDYGFDMYSDFLYTNIKLINSDMNMVENFKKASIKGWEYAYSNINKSVDLILKKYNSQNLSSDELIFEAKELKKLSFYNSNSFGDINKIKIQRMFDLYKLMGLVKKQINYKDFIFDKSSSLSFTDEERDYIKKKKVLKVCSSPSWLPYGKINEDGVYEGIAAEIISLISKKINIEIKIEPTNEWTESLYKFNTKKCDIIPLLIEIKDRHKFMNFTSSYFSQALVIATRDEELFIDKLKDVKNKKIAVLKNTAFIDILKKEYPSINIIQVNSPSEGLKKVNNLDVFAYIDTLVSIGYSIKKNSFYNLKIAGKLEHDKINFSMSTMINEPHLNNIIEKALNTVSKEERENIIKNWMSINFVEEIDYRIILEIVFFFITIFISLFIFIYKQNKLKEEIVNLNKTLEQRVKVEVENNRIKDIALFKQSKLASMGKMIRNIAHQWRQPLNRINLNLSIIKTVYAEENNKELIEKKILNAEKNIKYMSDTIDDFMNFFRPEKEKNIFPIYNAVIHSLKLLEGRTSDIIIELDISKEVRINNYKNEYLQVLLIILNNAIDNFATTHLNNKSIRITQIEKEDEIELYISDNSGGIKEENLEDIFEPYFTTKFKKEGAGLGLYMAKVLIEESMTGSLNVESSGINSTFIIKLKK